MRILQVAVVCVFVALWLVGCALAAGSTLKPVKMLVQNGVMRGVPSPDGRTVAATTTTGLYIIDIKTGKSRLLVSANRGKLLPDVQWSPSGKMLAYGLRPTRGMPTIQIINIASGRKVTLGVGFVWGWSPDGKRIAWHNMPKSTDTLVITDARTGKQVSQIPHVVTTMKMPRTWGGQPSRPAGPTSKADPRTWFDPGEVWFSPDCKKSVWSTTKTVAVYSGGGPGGDMPVHTGNWLSLYGPKGVERTILIPGSGPGNEIKSLLWYPDSSRVLMTTESCAPRLGLSVSKLYLVTVGGKATRIGVQKHKWIAFLRMLDPTQATIVYIAREGGDIDKSSLWIGQLSGVK